MRSKKKLPGDPVVAEVRAVRQQLWREAGGTMEGLLRLLDEIEPVAPKVRPQPRRTKTRRRRRR